MTSEQRIMAGRLRAIRNLAMPCTGEDDCQHCYHVGLAWQLVGRGEMRIRARGIGRRWDD